MLVRKKSQLEEIVIIVNVISEFPIIIEPEKKTEILKVATKKFFSAFVQLPHCPEVLQLGRQVGRKK